jgi:hypothetical protein
MARAAILAIVLASCRNPCLEDGPQPGFSIVSATDLGVLETTPSIRGRDGGYSATFSGRSVWLYGDTILASVGRTSFDPL